MHEEPQDSDRLPENAAAPDVATSSDAPRDMARRIEDLPAADGAAILGELPAELSADVTEYLDPDTAAGVLAEMDPALAATVIAYMEPPEASMVLAAMHPDDRVDILEWIPAPLHDTLLREMEPEDQAEVRQLEQYPPDSAGGIMTTQVTALPEDLTVEQAIAELRRLSEELEQMFYVYAIDRRQHLVGVLSMRDLILAQPGRRLNQIMSTDVMSVPATMDQEEVANLIRKYDYLAMPVVDSHHRLLGIITVDDVVDVMQEEATEDVQRMFGAGALERLNSPWHFSFRKRFVWLVVNLLTAFVAASVVGAFAGTIQKVVALAIYMPIIAGMGGNASAQAMAVAIRGIAMGKVDRAVLRHVMLRELRVGGLTGFIIGAVLAGVAMLFHAQISPMLGVVVGLALFINLTLACVNGAAIPFAMHKLGFDPAQSATIFATTVTDVVGFLCLLGLARVLL